MQGLTDGTVVPVFGVRHDGGQRHARRSRATHQRQRETPFLVKLDGRGDLHGRAAWQIARPFLRQIEQRPHRPRPLARPERGRHRHLAIRHFAQGAAVLARHPDRMRPRFREAGFVEDQNAAAFRDHRPQAAPDDLRVPRRMGDEVLEGLIRRGIADPLEHRRHRLARAVAQQTVDVLAQRHVLGTMAEAVLELIQPPRQSSQQRPRVPVEHCGAAYSYSWNRTMSSNLITRGFPRESHDLTKSY